MSRKQMSNNCASCSNRICFILIAFAFNAKSFAIAILDFLLFFPSCPFSWPDCRQFFRQRFKISYQVCMWPRPGSFLGHAYKYFRKNCSSNCYSRHVWHTTRIIHRNQHWQHPKKHKKQLETWNSETSS